MPGLSLIFPAPDMKEQALDYRKEHFDRGEFAIHGDGGLDEAESYEAWLEAVNAGLTDETDGKVPASTYFAVAGGRIVGTIQIRHRLNDDLFNSGGHIGYGVRPTERRKGYAGRMLALALGECRRLGIERALVTCGKDNAASARTILKNGGVLENEYAEPDGSVTLRYWIDVPRIRPAAEDDLSECLSVIRESFATVAAELGLTEENCPQHTSFMRLEQLREHFDMGHRMFVLCLGGKIAGYASYSAGEGDGEGEGSRVMRNLAVLPEYRHRGFGGALVDFIKDDARSEGGTKLAISIFEENTRLKNWYAEKGFAHAGTKTFDGFPLTVGFMECQL